MSFVTGLVQWLGWAGVIAGAASLAGVISGRFSVAYAGISLPTTVPGAAAILVGGIVLVLVGGMLRRRSGCSCCGGGE